MLYEARLFRFIPVLEMTPDIYRITSKYLGPTRSLLFDRSQNYLGFNQTNHTATNQHWFVRLRDTGDYSIRPVDAPQFLLTSNRGTYKVTVELNEYFCAWCLIEDGDFIGPIAPAS
ncbi:unnamed protein product [Rotaria sordida]|uniref:Uncharacterized protein n=1 Tax=Rotaria sordida TaxID=392033 RepID=A0A819EH77_9BILA|nr:unnamed protein product [Rotaria sordida]CAF1169615.1 unnamed protein product [Rotaria sordida]CAF1271631.1 unnamed protein product [Rotaria sordida]CAF1480729.1 unnamed protein product [Rotaria sordida]CAF1648083.1 unnamed protein product [Rotaria sordida]